MGDVRCRKLGVATCSLQSRVNDYFVAWSYCVQFSAAVLFEAVF